MKLVKERLPEYKARLPIDTDRIPHTLRDAMDLVRALGLRYIWVDSLCIVQDDSKEWSSVAPLMGKLYGSGYLNICAAAGQDANRGIPGSPATPRHAIQPVGRCFGVNLTVVRPVEDEIHSTTWNTRAWTFQERVLSPRSLICMEQRIYFQCSQVTWSEDIHAECESAIWTLDMVQSPVHALGSEVPILRFAESVSLYSARKLTFASDKLVAFDGLADIFEARLASGFVYGLPLAYFDWALLWENSAASNRIDISEGNFPSWSWCGWDGPTAWRSSTTAGLMDNLNAWLVEHTWIKWDLDKSLHIVAGDSSQDLDIKSHDTQHHRWTGYGKQWSTGKSTMTPSEALSTISPADLDKSPTHRTYSSGVLRFWSYVAVFRLAPTLPSETTGVELGNGLKRFNIIDNKNDWCGTIILDKKYQVLADENQLLEFVAISDAKGFTDDELVSWNYYIPEERGLAEWYLYYALLIRWNTESSIGERIGLGKVYKAAFANGAMEPGMRWKEVHLR